MLVFCFFLTVEMEATKTNHELTRGFVLFAVDYTIRSDSLTDLGTVFIRADAVSISGLFA